MTPKLEAAFGRDYEHCRARFLEAATAARAELSRFEHPGRGPHGETLSMDAAWLGPSDAEAVLVTISGTHGAEGQCGSGSQVALFESRLAEEVLPRIALLQVHAYNPHGFAWIRRTNEDNIDLNRNAVDHEAPHPENAGYGELHDLLCPEEWDETSIRETSRALESWRNQRGAGNFQKAITAGQYRFPDGLFYGGTELAWSTQTFQALLKQRLSGRRRVAFIDFHTGLGPRGHGERILIPHPGTPGAERASEWYDGDLTSAELGTSSSSPLNGVHLSAADHVLPEAASTAIALEYGTLKMDEVLQALRADNWLHARGDPTSEQGRRIKAQMLEAFYQDAPDWRRMVWERAEQTFRLTWRGLAES